MFAGKEYFCVLEVEISGGEILPMRTIVSYLLENAFFSFTLSEKNKLKPARAEIRRVTLPDPALSDLLFINWMSTVIVVVGHCDKGANRLIWHLRNPARE